MIGDKGAVVRALHNILQPFLLRRMKIDVEKDLPPKKEYLLYAPLTAQQKEMYQAIANRNIRQYLIDVKSGTSASDAIDVEAVTVPARKRARISYAIEDDEDKYMDDLENGRVHEPNGVVEKSAAEIGKAWQIKQAGAYCDSKSADSTEKSVNNMKLQNVVMQLRKVCDCLAWLIQDFMSSLPLRLAKRSHNRAGSSERGPHRRERQDAPAQSTARRAVRSQAQSLAFLAVYKDAGRHCT